MIDEKKIKEAARNHVNVFRKANPDGYSSSIIDIESDCMDNFKAGAKWAQQEFVKSLWHDASEESEEIDWEQRRYEIAKGMLLQYSRNDNNFSIPFGDEDRNRIALAIANADFLISELKKTSK